MPCHLECVHQPSREVTFLDSRIKVDLERRRIITKVYDKRSEMNCYQNVRTFPHVESILHRAKFRSMLLQVNSSALEDALRASAISWNPLLISLRACATTVMIRAL